METGAGNGTTVTTPHQWRPCLDAYGAITVWSLTFRSSNAINYFSGNLH